MSDQTNILNETGRNQLVNAAGGMSWYLVGAIFFAFLIVRPQIHAQTIYAYEMYSESGTSPALALDNCLDLSTNSYVLAQFTAPTRINGTLIPNNSGCTNILLMQFLFSTATYPRWVVAPVTDYTVSHARVGCPTFGGYTYVAGSFSGTNLTFGATTITNLATVADHSADIFLAAFDFNGNLAFLKQAGGSADDLLGSMVTDSSGNCYVTGTFKSPTFSADAFSLVRQSTSGGDCFTIKYDSGGNVLWIKQGSYANGCCLTVDSAGNCYVGGTISGPATFDGVSPSNPTTTNFTTTNFLAKYNSSGTLLWVRGDLIVGNYLTVDSSQNIYTTGTFSNVLNFSAISLTNQAASTIFVAEYDSNGNVLWANQLPGLGDDSATGLVVDNQAHCWVSGYFAAAASPTNTVAAIANYDQNGNLFALSHVNPAYASMVGNVTTGGGGPGANVFIAGSYSTNFNLGNQNILNNHGNLDVFSARLLILPEVTMTRTGTNFVTSWPAFISTGFTLQTSPNISAGNWSSLGSGTTVNGQNVITNTITSGAHFYRLQHN
jgi:hypothetical protein